MVLLVGAMWGLSMSYRSPLPQRLDDKALAAGVSSAVSRPDVSGSTPRTPETATAGPAPTDGQRPSAPSPAEVAPPTPEQFQQSWPRFRGPLGDGVSRYTNIPTTWDAASGEAIVWKAPIPLPGNNSPIVWGDRVFLSGATPERREVYCLDAATGQIAWQKEVRLDPALLPPEEISEDTGYAAPTMATDGRRVFAGFVNGDVVAFDFAGNQLWLFSPGVPENPYGHASSLVTHGDLLIVQLDQGTGKDGKSKLLALRGDTGEQAWETPREVRSCWSTPIVVQHDGQPQLLVTGDPWVMAYSSDEGREIWRVQRRGQDVASSPVYAGGLAYIASEFPGLWAIDAGGQGNVTETHVKWMADFGAPDTTSPLVANGLVLLAASFGTLTCYDAQEGGEPLWEKEFEASFSSSPSLVGDHVYLFGTDGKAWVIKPGRDGCEQVGQADLGEPCVTCPAFQDGRMYVRGQQHLFCIGVKK